MSKYVKELQMKTMETLFSGVTEVVIADVVGLDSKQSYDLRVELRKKKINLQVVPNNLARKVFERMGLPPMDGMLQGSSAVIWGGEGIIELAREISDFAKKLEKLQLKGLAMAGQAMVGKEQVEKVGKMPSRLEVLGQIAGMLIGPVSAVINLATGPGSLVASQLQTIADKEKEGEPAA
jgi:large subunit ribosomal protein L10